MTIDLPRPDLSAPSPVFLPVTAIGCFVVDRDGKYIAECFTPKLATQIAVLLNQDAEVR